MCVDNKKKVLESQKRELVRVRGVWEDFLDECQEIKFLWRYVISGVCCICYKEYIVMGC